MLPTHAALIRTQPLDPELPNPLPMPPAPVLAESTAHVTDTGSLALTTQLDPYASPTGSQPVLFTDEQVTEGSSEFDSTDAPAAEGGSTAVSADQPGTGNA
ncbi:hypothetical protein [Kocuria atrinae]|uniref:hypothetical protein n=1 Tax=Kocuria atrinae TaxID=592377 RepID=UPI0002FB1C7E|nr:hypothetical protein [Kocuria atrinae]